MHPETGYKLCKFCENRARDTPMWGFIFHILIKSQSKFQFWCSYTLTIAPIGVKFGTEEGTKEGVPSSLLAAPAAGEIRAPPNVAWW